MFAPKQPNKSGHHPNKNRSQEKKPFVLQRQGLNAGIQEKLKVGQTNDRFEKEADSVADQVVSNSEAPKVEAAPTPPIQTMKVGSGDLTQRVLREPQHTESDISTSIEVQKESQADVETEAQLSDKSGTSSASLPQGEVQLKEEEEVQLEKLDEQKVAKADIETEAQLKAETEVQTKSEPEPVQAKIEETPIQKIESTPEPPRPIFTPPVQLKTESPPEEEVQLKEDEEMSEEAQSVQMKSKDIASGDDVSSQIASSKGGGSFMDDTIKSDMESGFGHDFSNVRIHTDSQAANMSASLGAKAFTAGSDIYFNDGEYRPDTKDGKHLLAHELTHTLQQGAVGSDQIQKKALDGGELMVPLKTRYIPAMSKMSQIELAVHCFHESTGAPKEEIEGYILSGALEINGFNKITPEDVKRFNEKNNGYYRFSLSVGWFQTLTGVQIGTSNVVDQVDIDDVSTGPVYKPSNEADGVEESSAETGGSDFDQIDTGNQSSEVGGITGEGGFGEKRGEDGRRTGAADRDEYYEALPKDEQIEVVDETNKRFFDQFGLSEEYRIQEDTQQWVKDHWKELRDQVIIEQQSIEPLPERLKQFFTENKPLKPDEIRKYHELLHALNQLDEIQLETLDRMLSGDTPVEMDYDEMRKLAELMEDFTPMDYMEYMSMTSRDPKSLKDFREAVEKYLEKKAEKQKELEEFEEVKTKLFGLEELYKAYKKFKKKESKHYSGGENFVGDGMDQKMDDRIYHNDSGNQNRIDRKREKLTTRMKENGFESIEQFEKFIEDYKWGFEQQAIRTAEDHMLKYRHQLWEEEKRLKDDAYVETLFKQLNSSDADTHFSAAYQAEKSEVVSIKDSGHSYDTVKKIRAKAKKDGAAHRKKGREALGTMDTFLVKEEQFEHAEFSHIKSKSEMKTFLTEYIQDKYESINKAWYDIHEDRNYIYELDALYNATKQEQGVSDNDIFGMILKDKKDYIDDLNMLKTIGIIFLAVLLTILTYGAAAPYAAAAGVASAGFSLYAVYEAVEEYKKDNAANDVGLLTTDPSYVWVFVAIVGAVFDLGALGKVLGASSKITKATAAFNKGGSLVKLEKELGEITELTAKMRQNVLKSAKLRREGEEVIEKMFAHSSGALKSTIVPGGEKFAKAIVTSYYMARQGIISFEQFLLKLKVNKVIDDFNSLTPKEKRILKGAFKKGKLLQEADPHVITQIDEAIDIGDYIKVEKLINDSELRLSSQNYALNYSKSVKTNGKFKKASGYHGDSRHLFSDSMVSKIISEPDYIYITSNGKKLVYQKGGDVVIVSFEKSGRGNVITAYGESGIKGDTGAKALGGLPSDPGLPVTHEMILNGEIPTSSGYLPSSTQIYP
ncbi:MAG: hypothetical protein Crog4KO_27110 [Crocinitomicaceae bacterium]